MKAGSPPPLPVHRGPNIKFSQKKIVLFTKGTSRRFFAGFGVCPDDWKKEKKETKMLKKKEKEDEKNKKKQQHWKNKKQKTKEKRKRKNKKTWKKAKMQKWTKETKKHRKCENSSEFSGFLSSHAKSSIISRVCRCCCNFVQWNPQRFPWLFGMCGKIFFGRVVPPIFLGKFRILPWFQFNYMIRIRFFGPCELNQNGFSAAQSRRSFSSICCSQDWMKHGGLILWNGFAICEMSKTSWQKGKLLMKDGFGEPLKGPIIPFGALVEYYPISTRDFSRLHQFGKNVLAGIFFGFVLIAVRDLERRYSDCRHGRFGKVRRIRRLSSKNQREGDPDQTKKQMNSYSQ